MEWNQFVGMHYLEMKEKFSSNLCYKVIPNCMNTFLISKTTSSDDIQKIMKSLLWVSWVGKNKGIHWLSLGKLHYGKRGWRSSYTSTVLFCECLQLQQMVGGIRSIKMRYIWTHSILIDLIQLISIEDTVKKIEI
jgi:hypothetical protein